MNELGERPVSVSSNGNGAPVANERKGRSPTVAVQLEEGRVVLSLTATLWGDGGDWDETMAGAFWLELWSRLRAMAQLHADYGIAIKQPAPPPWLLPGLPQEGGGSTANLVEEESPLPAPTPKTDATPDLPPEPSTRGNRVSRAVLIRQERQILIALANLDGEQRSMAIQAAVGGEVAELANGAMLSRLRRLEAAGLVASRKQEHEFQSPLYWRVTGKGMLQAQADQGEGLVEAPLAEVRRFLSGKVLLVYGAMPGTGGHGKRIRVKEMEATLGVREVRWPDFDESDTLPIKLKELERQDVDVVLINRFNRHHIQSIVEKAAERCVPLVRMSAGISLTQIVAALHRSLPELTRVAAAG